MNDCEQNFDENQKKIFDNNLRNRFIKHRKELDDDDKMRYRSGFAVIFFSNIFFACI